MKSAKFRSIEVNPLRLCVNSFNSEKINNSYILIKTIKAGICRSDLKEIVSSRTKRSDFGHEFVGKVISTSKDLSNRKGDYVILWPEIEVQRTSGFGEYVLAKGTPTNLNKAFFKVNINTGTNKLIFCEPMSCAYHCVSRLRKYIRNSSFKNKKVAIIGAGNAGTLMGLIINHLGGEAYLLNRGSDRLHFLKDKNVFNTKNLISLSSITDYQDIFDGAIVATTFLSKELIYKGMSLVKNSSPLVLFGGTKKGLQMEECENDIDFIRRNQETKTVEYKKKNVKLVGTYGSTLTDFKNVIKIIETDKKMPIENLIERTISFDILMEEFKRILNSNKYNKVAIDFK